MSELQDSHGDFNITATGLPAAIIQAEIRFGIHTVISSITARGLPAAIHKLVIWKIHTVIYYS